MKERTSGILENLGIGEKKELIEEDQNELLKLAIQQGETALRGQRGILDSIRRRSMNLVAINGGVLVLARFISSEQKLPGFASAGFSLAELFAIASFLCAVFLCLTLLKSHNGFHFELSAEKIISRYIRSKNFDTMRDVYEDFAIVLDDRYKQNNEKLDGFHQRVFGAVCFTACHAIFWLLGGFVL